MNNEQITIVSGLPRSGTSMMMRMIEAGGIPALVDHVREADVDNPRGYYEFEPVKKTKEDASWLAQAAGKVVKMVHLLLLDLPTDRDYRVVFTHRELDEVLRSQNIMLERRGKGLTDLPTDKVKQIFQAQIDKVLGRLRDHDCFSVLEVKYNDTLADPAPTIAALNGFLGGELDTDAMRAVVEPALYRNRTEWRAPRRWSSLTARAMLAGYEWSVTVAPSAAPRRDSG